MIEWRGTAGVSASVDGMGGSTSAAGTSAGMHQARLQLAAAERCR